MKIESYADPATLREALEQLAHHGERSRVLAGGTDLVLRLRAADRDFRGALVNIKRVSGLRGIWETPGGLEIGALTSVTDLLHDESVASRAPILRDTADRFGSAQVRNAATVGGNLVNASPAADLAIPLLVLDARVRLARMDGDEVRVREVPLSEFITGPGRTLRTTEELLTAVRLPPPPSGFTARFQKAGTRPALDISVVSVGVGFTRAGGRIAGARVALGAVAPTPMRSPGAEQALEGEPAEPDRARYAAEAAARDVRPIDDVRASAWYRRHLVRVFVEREVLGVLEA